ncbi:hypothetical protein ABT174_38645 [Streptomyces sparsogenes]|uniref:hypothetical protein n=1 Tax=Streptomyces sparsogenes TaxID=67365 RepID=UPI00331BEF57
MTVAERANTRTVKREVYVDLFGPTTGDVIRLADTALRIKITDDWSGGQSKDLRGAGETVRGRRAGARSTVRNSRPPAARPRPFASGPFAGRE